jgi:hypothetical protein
MGWGEWMAGAQVRTLEQQAIIEIQRRSVQAMPEADLRALCDSLVIQAHTQGALLKAAMRRIAELEIRHELFPAATAVNSVQPERQRDLRPERQRLWLGWRRRGGTTEDQPQALQ